MFLPLGDDVDKRHFPAVGSILIALNFLVYIYQTRLWNEAAPSLMPFLERGDTASFLTAFKQSDYWDFNRVWGASPENVRKGHVMSLVTHMFLHADFFHILGNMLVLWAFVGTLEVAMGPGTFFFFYLLWGVAGAATHLYVEWHQKDLPLIGASGAISGMIGAYFVAFGALTRIRALLWFIVPIKVIYIPAGLFVFLWVLSQLAGIADDEKYGMSNVAWYAHVGGFALGAFTMLAMREQVLGRMGRDKSGNLIIAAEGAEEKKPASAAAPTGTPTACPNCGTPITEEHRIHSSMFRCPKPECQKLIFQQ